MCGLPGRRLTIIFEAQVYQSNGGLPLLKWLCLLVEMMQCSYLWLISVNTFTVTMTMTVTMTVTVTSVRAKVYMCVHVCTHARVRVCTCMDGDAFWSNHTWAMP
jgi:hypothetical protein